MVPELNFTIPSVHDDIPLDCRIYFPSHKPPTASSPEKAWWARGAIIAHPYTSFGGSYDDCVVLSTVAEILQLGFVVGTFNFRGAGSSKGRASWTARAELADYVSFVGFFIHYLSGLRPLMSLESSLTLSDDSATASPTSPQSSMASPPRITLLLGGYSYGSLITCYLPPMKDILDRFSTITRGTVEDEIRLRALNLSTQRNKEIRMRCEAQRGRSFRAKEKLGSPAHSIAIAMGGEESEAGSRRSSRESRSLDILRKSVDYSRKSLRLRKSSSRIGSEAQLGNDVLMDFTINLPLVYYLLISPLLPPISSLATMFSKFSIHPLLSKWSTLASAKHQKSLQPEDILTTNPTLAIYGDNDFFSSQKKLRKWAESLAQSPRSTFQFREIPNAGHFWQEQGVETQMRSSIREWLQRLLINLDNIDPVDRL